ncbi:type III secretion system inner rod subunit SctI [Hahella ganghwensis]|uniref:type III secretion system inner rod subunit SctI n=1 Tax=Hahella ganghwensis TaxID=286420 RepID=UPI00037D5BCC|nr:type III secretion system inner rod subunit SctI [Hahella ganghwensis]
MDPVNIQYSLNIANSDKIAATDQVADPGMVEYFQQNLQGHPAGSYDQSASGVSPIQGTDQAVGTLGDKILRGLQSVKSGYDNQVGAVQESLESTDPLNINDMMAFQLDLAKLTLQGELINKTVSKSTQNLDALLKSQ